jgi:diguanylate cyclase
VSWIDATIVASGFGLLSWVFLMAPTAGSNDLSWQSRLVALAYPVWDVLFLALLVRLLAGLGASARPAPACWCRGALAGLRHDLRLGDPVRQL